MIAETAEPASIDVVICYYNKDGADHLRYMTLHSVAFLQREAGPDLTVIVVDGSPREDVALSQALSALNTRYLHGGCELSFAQTYNAGIEHTVSRVVVTLANDILIGAQQIRLLAGEIRGNVGCAIPYLTSSDYGTQLMRRLPVPRRSFPTQMTLNVNAFSREALQQVGGIPEDMTGCFNDVILCIRLREARRSIVLRNVGKVFHFGQQTLQTGQTGVSYQADLQAFQSAYPEYWRRNRLQSHKFAQRPLARLLYRISDMLPPRIVATFGVPRAVWALEPYLTGGPAIIEAGKRLFRRLCRGMQ
jgi:hypothetical protein